MHINNGAAEENLSQAIDSPDPPPDELLWWEQLQDDELN